MNSEFDRVFCLASAALLFSVTPRAVFVAFSTVRGFNTIRWCHSPSVTAQNYPFFAASVHRMLNVLLFIYLLTYLLI